MRKSSFSEAFQKWPRSCSEEAQEASFLGGSVFLRWLTLVVGCVEFFLCGSGEKLEKEADEFSGRDQLLSESLILL